MNQRGDLRPQKPVRKQTQSCWHKINKILSLFIHLLLQTGCSWSPQGVLGGSGYVR